MDVWRRVGLFCERVLTALASTPRDGDGTRLPHIEVEAPMSDAKPARKQPGLSIEPEGVTDQEALALVMYMLFGPRGTLSVEEGGYMRWNEGGRMTAGILEQIDQRLVRLEEFHELEPLRFVADKEE